MESVNLQKTFTEMQRYFGDKLIELTQFPSLPHTDNDYFRAYVLGKKDFLHYFLRTPSVTDNYPGVVIDLTEDQNTSLVSRGYIPSFQTAANTAFVERVFFDVLSFTPYQPQWIHGSLVNIEGIGVLVRGPSGSGKTRLLRKLIERGFAMVSDDVVECDRLADTICGRSVLTQFGLLADREEGLIDIIKHYGSSALCSSMPIDLVIDLGNKDHKMPVDIYGQSFMPIPLSGESVDELIDIVNAVRWNNQQLVGAQ